MQFLTYDRSSRDERRLVTTRALRALAVVLLVVGVLACNAYDAAWLTVSSACGNGRLELDEACDPAIEAGEPGACPEECASEDRCAPSVLVGNGCQRRCVAQY